MQVFRDLKSFWNHRELIKQLTIRETTGRYKGSYLGVLWSIITPIIMLVIYTFVFSVIFKAKWNAEVETSKLEFAMLLFCGIITFNILAEVISRAPSLITNNANYVKKVIFPLEILPLTILGSALFHALIGIIILILSILIFMGTFHLTIVFLPIVLLPVVFISIGFAWILSSLGVYLRDINQFIGVAVQALMFLSPVFYPISVIPKDLQFLYYLNPISYVIDDMRRIIIWGEYPNWFWLIIGILSSLVISILGYIWFKKTRSGFADVL